MGEIEQLNHDDTLVISVRIANAQLKRIVVDTESSIDILYLDAFQKLSLTKEDLTMIMSMLTRVTRDSISPLGIVVLSVTLGEEPRSKTIMVTFMVLELPSSYNAILGCPTLNKFRTIISSYHQAIKFPMRARVGEVRSDPWESRRCCGDRDATKKTKA